MVNAWLLQRRSTNSWPINYPSRCATGFFRCVGKGPLSQDFKYRDQLRDAARSAPRNLSEGFARFQPAQFANLTRVALGSLGEVIDALNDGEKARYYDAQERESLVALATRALKTTRGLLRYLDSCDGQAPTGWDARPKPKRKRKAPNLEP